MLIKKGDKGSKVKEIQRILGLTADGIFGAYTEAAVKRYQKKAGLVPDGIVGPKTYDMLIGGDTALETDRFGYDDSNDTDNKLEYLGDFKTKEGLTIDKAYLDSDEYVRDYGKIKPVNFYIHHTAGWNNPYATINSWNRDSRGRVATQWCIGGINIKNGEAKYDGVVVEAFPNNYVGWHIGKIANFEIGSKLTSAVEINNFGYLKKKGDKYYNYVDVEVPKDMVCDLGYEFRGYRYYHKYTDKQIESLRLLIEHVRDIYPTINVLDGIPQMLKDGVDPKDAFEFNADAYYGKKTGLWSHTSVRKDKFDCFPQPELVEMLKNLK
jgi:hypothetical protein